MKILNFAHSSHTWRYYYATVGKTEATLMELTSGEYTSNIVKNICGSISVKNYFVMDSSASCICGSLSFTYSPNTAATPLMILAVKTRNTRRSLSQGQ